MNTETYYTPGRIARRVGVLPYLLVLPVGDMVKLDTKRHERVDSGTAIDNAVCEQADLERALLGLPVVQCLAITAYYLLDVDLADIAARYGLSQAETGALIWDGVKRMARALGWRERREWQLRLEDGNG